MILKTMWGKRASEPATAPPELMVAWDEYSVGAFPEGFEAAGVVAASNSEARP